MIVVAGALACTSSHAATPERFDAAPVKKTFAKNYKFVPMLLVTHEAGGDALASEPLDAALSDEPFKTVTDTTHWGMVEGNTYYHLPSFDIYAVANLLPRSDPNKNPLEEMKAKPGGFMLTQFITPNCKSCDKLAQTLVQWMETNKARPMRWVVVDLSTSNLR
ncbi:MAG TPA: hypothetical protein VGT79_04450, partial [Xanthomonadaceae bacterium]|nr:hypothetical protein [Xanthomonadaceae bacterium]